MSVDAQPAATVVGMTIQVQEDGKSVSIVARGMPAAAVADVGKHLGGVLLALHAGDQASPRRPDVVVTIDTRADRDDVIAAAGAIFGRAPG